MVTAAICAVLWLPGMGTAAWLLTARHLWLFPGVWLIATLSILPVVSLVSSISWWPHPRNIVLNRLRRATAWKRLGATAGIAAVIGLASAGLGGGSFSLPFALSFLVCMGVGVALMVRDSVSIWPLLVGGTATGLILTPVTMAVLGFLGAAGGLLSGLAAGGLTLIAATKLALRTSSAVPDYVRNPAFESYIRRDVRTGLVASTLVSAIVLPTIMIDPTLRASLAISVVASVSAGLSVGFGLVAETWRRYVAMLAVMRRRFPVRFNRLLMSAYRAGMLRRAGIAFQFRHLELRDYFGG
jgi:hypothetical protein